jgi:hypothetical protein
VREDLFSAGPAKKPPFLASLDGKTQPIEQRSPSSERCWTSGFQGANRFLFPPAARK